MADHQAILRDFRALEERVKPWADMFARVSNRQPTWHDAEEHGGPEFGAAFKVMGGGVSSSLRGAMWRSMEGPNSR